MLKGTTVDDQDASDTVKGFGHLYVLEHTVKLKAKCGKPSNFVWPARA